MADYGRPMSFLPTIKCSTCGQDIEIALLAEHICGPASSEPQATFEIEPARLYTPYREPTRHDSPVENYLPTSLPQPFAKEPTSALVPRSSQDQHRTAPLDWTPEPSEDSLGPYTKSKASGFLKPGRNVPPRIDAAAANRPFLTPDPQTPGSSYSNFNDGRSTAPNTPSTQLTSPASMMSRKPGAISRTPSPPSPHLQPNLDSAFPPFPLPVQEPTRRQSPAGNKTRKPGLIPGNKSLMAPVSPRMNGGADVLKRMDTIAPGPFAGMGKRQEGKETPSRQISLTKRDQFDGSKGNDFFRRPSTAQSQGSHTSNMSETSSKQQYMPTQGPGQQRTTPPRPFHPADDVDSFLKQLQSDNDSGPSYPAAARSKTFPEPGTNAAEPVRRVNTSREGRPPFQQVAAKQRTDRPSAEPPLRSAGLSPANDPFGWSKDGELPRPATSRGNPPGSIDMKTSAASSRMQPYYPPMPSQSAVQRQASDESIESSTSHGASNSASTTYSTSSSNGRSQTSSENGWPSGADMSRSRSESRTRGDGRHERSNTAGSSRSRSYSTTRRDVVHPQPPEVAWNNLPESPLDPAIQWGVLPPMKHSERDRLPRGSPPRQEAKSIPPKPRAEALLQSRNNEDFLSPSMSQKSKGKCTACGLHILGKSVRAADGRLPGRYHKECFVCKACSSPFPTGEFYVLNNNPYCAAHYHKLNNSCCKSCDRGIEGQYLETDRKEKFHPRCFACTTCRVALAEDYYEVDGRPYCQRHAFSIAKTNALGGSLRANPERRRTRLMMM